MVQVSPCCFIKEPVGAVPSYDSVVSKVAEGGSCNVSEADQRVIFDSLQTRLKPALHEIFQWSVEGTAERLMRSDDPALRHVGFLMAMDFSIVEPDEKGQYPESLKEPIAAYARQNRNLVRRLYQKRTQSLIQG